MSDSETIETFEVDLVAGRLYQTRIVRQSLAKVVRPLEREGIDLFASGQDGVTQTVITKEEAVYFEMAASEADVVSDTTTSMVMLQIESAAFKEDNKWRFSDRGTPFFAEIADQEFLQRINAGIERFGKRDVLLADLRRVQTVTDNGLKLEHIIVKVQAHKEPLQQELLPR